MSEHRQPETQLTKKFTIAVVCQVLCETKVMVITSCLHRTNHLLTESEVFTGKYQTETLLY